MAPTVVVPGEAVFAATTEAVTANRAVRQIWRKASGGWPTGGECDCPTDAPRKVDLLGVVRRAKRPFCRVILVHGRRLRTCHRAAPLGRVWPRHADVLGLALWDAHSFRRVHPEPSICAFRQWLWQVAAVAGSGSGFGDALLHALLVERREPVGPERLPVRDVIG